ncbi:hypothetical protein [Pseudomonas viridiflava]|uniref:hypothetical protein n=1 Tax=Pseudomonas viridiflava TaxID=33069 RepID=UPI001C3187B6|nr:hypothetical protein [Pseudomonas viridiflava]QXG31679.1 hypothetical protein KTT59_06545 [Pseudomonas viridiflava]
MKNAWLSAKSAVERLEKAAQQTVTLSDLKRICVSGYCGGYIQCEGVHGSVIETSKNVRGIGNQLLRNPGRIRPKTIRYFGRPPQDILSITKNIQVQGKVTFDANDDSGVQAEEDVVWKLMDETRTYPVLFKSSDIAALADVQGLLKALRLAEKNAQHKNSLATNMPSSMLGDTVEQLRGQLEYERRAREAAEKELELVGGSRRTSHLLTVAGLLELLLQDDNKPRYDQGTIAMAIDSKGWRGASASTITKLFAEAKAAAIDAEKVTQARAEARDATKKRKTRE